jgi:hypothetical protein
MFIIPNSAPRGDAAITLQCGEIGLCCTQKRVTQDQTIILKKKIAAIGPGEVASACNPSYSGGNQQNRGLRPALGKHWRTYVRKIKSYRDIAQVVKSLPSKCKALSSNPSTTKNKKQKISEVG